MLLLRSHNIEFYEDERLGFDWKEQLDSHLVAFRNVDGDSTDSDDDIGPTVPILTPPETPVIAPTVLANIGATPGYSYKCSWEHGGR